MILTSILSFFQNILPVPQQISNFLSHVQMIETFKLWFSKELIKAKRKDIRQPNATSTTCVDQN